MRAGGSPPRRKWNLTILSGPSGCLPSSPVNGATAANIGHPQGVPLQIEIGPWVTFAASLWRTMRAGGPRTQAHQSHLPSLLANAHENRKPLTLLNSQFPILNSPFSILHSPFPIPHSPFSIPHSPFSILHSQFPILHSPLSILHSQFSIYFPVYEKHGGGLQEREGACSAGRAMMAIRC